jgi:hypothetical protein
MAIADETVSLDPSFYRLTRLMLDPHDRHLRYGVEWGGGEHQRELCSDPGAVRVCPGLRPV